jgi:cyclopropane-fatty-acyl-phospholipid synthase
MTTDVRRRATAAGSTAIAAASRTRNPSRAGVPAPTVGRAPGPAAAIARALVLAALRGIRDGAVTVQENGRVQTLGDPRAPHALRATLTVADPGFWTAALTGGSAGAADAYADGLWDCDDLPALFRIFARNAGATEQLRRFMSVLSGPARRLAHLRNRNTRDGSRRNIAAHYDLSNAFFALWLDRTMTYSAGLFPPPDAPATRGDRGAAFTLEDASLAKYDRICRALDLGPDDHVLEIGTGWGGFAIYAAHHFGCRVTTTTISAEQHAEAVRRVARAGLSGRVDLLRQDYRDLSGTYDKLVSIEMIEAVGHAYLPEFFRVCTERLRPGGRMLLQAILIQDELYDRARRTVDVIKQQIFPGTDIPSRAALAAAIGQAGSDLALVDDFDLTHGYAETLRHWRERCDDQAEAIDALGFDRRFRRLWRFYLAYCEGGFREHRIMDGQLMFVRPGEEPAHAAPAAPATFAAPAGAPIHRGWPL